MVPSSWHAATWPLLASCLAAACLGASSAKDSLDILFMADIGHPREHADTLTYPWPMGKCAMEGAFSLYEGMYDYIQNQGVQPQAVLIMGDVAYCGGDAACTNQTSDAFQKYTNGKVPRNMVFPQIGNHDVHYLGCAAGEFLPPASTVSASDEKAADTLAASGLLECHYGSGHDLFKSVWQMTFEEWRHNWLAAFPGLADSIILPPPRDNPTAPSHWLAPVRYNIDFGKDSKVYFIAGLLAGVLVTTWNGDTPRNAVDSTTDEAAAELECNFLRDSLAHGRRLGKTVFIYLTHNFDKAGCNDWSVIKQIDVWLTGHKHNLWQSPRNKAAETQEGRHYPHRVLIGNGGFDEAHIDVVSFGRLREERFNRSGQERIRLSFDILDTCRSPEGACPSERISTFANCWSECQDAPGGYDGGGGPRKAHPNKYGLGFTFEAPLAPQTSAPSYRLRFGDGDMALWLALGRCGVVDNQRCIIGVNNSADAAMFTMYDTYHAADPNFFTARLAVDDENRAPVIRGIPGMKSDWLIQHPYGFWDKSPEGFGTMQPHDGWVFRFKKSERGWQVEGLGWESSLLRLGHWVLYTEKSQTMAAVFQAEEAEILV